MEIGLNEINNLTLAIQEFSSQTSLAFDNIIAKVGEMCNELSKISTLSAGTVWNDIYDGSILILSGLSTLSTLKESLSLAAISQGILTAATTAWSGICTAGTAITTAFGAAIAFLTSPVGLFIAGIAAVAAAIALIVVYWDEVVAAFTVGFEYLNEVFMGIPMWLYENVILPVIEAVMGFFEAIGEFLVAYLTTAMDMLSTSLSFVMDVIGWLLGVIAEAISFIAGGVNGLVSLLMNIFVALLTFISATILAPLLKLISHCIVGIINVFTGMVDLLKKLFLMLMGFVDTVFLKPLITGTKFVVNSILAFVEGLVNGAISGINSIINAFNRIEFSIPDWVPVIGGNSFGFSLSTYPTVSLPRLAKGAVIPPSNQFLAILGDQTSGKNIETPESLMRQIFRQELAGAKGSGEMNVNVYLDGKQITATVEKYQRERGVTMVKGGLLYGV
ncbi:MAG: hypothetical protein RSF82_12095 [Angelakisella sp.]